MDKLIFFAIGAGALIVAISDQIGGNSSNEYSAENASSNNAQYSGGSYEAPLASAAVSAPSSAPADYSQPVNPTPVAADLGGKVIDSTFQPDG